MTKAINGPARPVATPPLAPKAAVQYVVDRFPIPGYINLENNNHLHTATCLRRHLAPGARVLDFGAGPCDLTAVVQAMGFECFACDDLTDAWHEQPGMRETILSFAESAGIRFVRNTPGSPLPFQKEQFDLVMLTDVVEHLHESPRYLLNTLLELVKTNGLLLITVPNAGNIRKRLTLLLGGTNYPRYDVFYWYPGPWRGHVREYVKDDLECLTKNLGLELLELSGCDRMLAKVPAAIRKAFAHATNAAKGWKDSWVLVARKPTGWRALAALPDVQTRAGIANLHDH